MWNEKGWCDGKLKKTANIGKYNYTDQIKKEKNENA
jgi:hypothetical protein